MEGNMARVLLVDDDLDVLEALQAWLRRRKHEVQIAAGFPEALAALASGPIPDVLITDWDMAPFCGDDLLAIVARRYPGVCRVLHSGTPRPKGSSPAAQHILSKGCDLADLDAVVSGCARAA
jgi:DNA-binding NtrC family response regulator